MHFDKLLQVFFRSVDVLFFEEFVHVLDLLQLDNSLFFNCHFLNCFDKLSEFIRGFVQAILS